MIESFNRDKNSGFSTIVVIILTSFLLVTITGLLQVYMLESRASHGTFQSLAAQYAADGAGELLLYEAKGKIGFETNTIASGSLLSGIFSNISVNGGLYQAHATSATGTLTTGETRVYPLFYYSGGTRIRTQSPVLTAVAQISWTLSSEAGSISETSVSFSDASLGFSRSIAASTSDTEFYVEDKKTNSVATLLSSSNEPYLVITNTSSTPIEYSLQSSTPFSLQSYQVLLTASLNNSLNIPLAQQEYRWERKSDITPELLKYSVLQN